eukprot:9837310-Lingulodinium_polyedra.AAC.1
MGKAAQQLLRGVVLGALVDDDVGIAAAAAAAPAAGAAVALGGPAAEGHRCGAARALALPHGREFHAGARADVHEDAPLPVDRLHVPADVGAHLLVHIAPSLAHQRPMGEDVLQLCDVLEAHGAPQGSALAGRRALGLSSRLARAAAAEAAAARVAAAAAAAAAA